MTSNDSAYDPEYLEFVRLFNDGEFDDCHHTLMGLWHRNMSYSFYKGLIQLAGAFQHWSTENAFWAEDLFASAHNLLEKYAPRHEGLDIDQLSKEIRACHDVARQARERGSAEGLVMPVIQLRLAPSGE